MHTIVVAIISALLLFTSTSQGHENEGLPSESECRPYIEKALQGVGNLQNEDTNTSKEDNQHEGTSTEENNISNDGTTTEQEETEIQSPKDSNEDTASKEDEVATNEVKSEENALNEDENKEIASEEQQSIEDTERNIEEKSVEETQSIEEEMTEAVEELFDETVQEESIETEAPATEENEQSLEEHTEEKQNDEEASKEEQKSGEEIIDNVENEVEESKELEKEQSEEKSEQEEEIVKVIETDEEKSEESIKDEGESEEKESDVDKLSEEDKEQSEELQNDEDSKHSEEIIEKSEEKSSEVNEKQEEEKSTEKDSKEEEIQTEKESVEEQNEDGDKSEQEGAEDKIEDVQSGKEETESESQEDKEKAQSESLEEVGETHSEPQEDDEGQSKPEEEVEEAQSESQEVEKAQSESQEKVDEAQSEPQEKVDAQSEPQEKEDEALSEAEEELKDAQSELQEDNQPQSEPPEEEELSMVPEMPEKLRSRDHMYQILHLDAETEETEKILSKTVESTLKELKKLYDAAIKPLEILYKYRDLSNRHFGDPEIFSKPLILFMGPWSGGKSTIINYLMENEYKQTALRTGADPSPAYFNIVMWGEEPEIVDGTQLAADWTFSGLQKFGQGLLDRLKGLKLNHPLLQKVNIVEIPGILEIRKQVERLFPFNDACQWFIDRADIIFLVYDPSKLDIGPETEAILDQLKGREMQTRIILNKADQVKPEELMRVQGTLIWNISPLMSSTEPPVMYSTSLWSLPYEAGSPTRLLLAQEKAFLTDLRSAIDKRVENKIAGARRFAVRVRNHAKMVDCYLTTYYNHKSIFDNKKHVSDDIIEHPQNYHIYEGLSTLTNISRYDLPDPETYRDFFRLNPVYEFQQLSATCTYFRGCPINRLDLAIAYDLPELIGKYKKSVEEVLKLHNKEK